MRAVSEWYGCASQHRHGGRCKRLVGTSIGLRNPRSILHEMAFVCPDVGADCRAPGFLELGQLTAPGVWFPAHRALVSRALLRRRRDPAGYFRDVSVAKAFGIGRARSATR